MSNRKKRPRPSDTAGFLLTCEPSREVKCRVEGLSLLEYYYHKLVLEGSTDKKPSSDHALSMEDELQQLRQEGRSQQNSSTKNSSSPFVAMNLGCKGVVILLYRDEYMSESSSDENYQFVDPLRIHQAVFDDIAQNTTCSAAAPSTRFLLRLVPLQQFIQKVSTVDHLTASVATLLGRWKNETRKRQKNAAITGDATTTTTFAITVKRRLTNWKRLEIIHAVARAVEDCTENWKVDLNHPDVTICVDVCKHCAGVTLDPGDTSFNVASARDRSLKQRLENEET